LIHFYKRNSSNEQVYETVGELMTVNNY